MSSNMTSSTDLVSSGAQVHEDIQWKSGRALDCKAKLEDLMTAGKFGNVLLTGP
jgi:hypothetical protein